MTQSIDLDKERTLKSRAPLSTTLFRFVFLGVGFLFLGFYLFIALKRLTYPFELEWMEGSLVDQVNRILAGKKLYVRPSLEFIPYIYPPLFSYVSAGVAKLTGPGFVPLRLVSLISSLGSFFCIFLLVKKETGKSFYGLISMCMFAGTYYITGSWFDVGRVDSFLLFLLLAALYLIRFARSRHFALAAGILLALAFLTKQTAISVVLPLFIYSLIFQRRLVLYLVGSFGVIAGGATLILNSIHQGWYKYYVFDLPREHPTVNSMFLDFITNDLFSEMTIAMILALFYLFTQMTAATKDRFFFYLSLTVGLTGASFLPRFHEGGFENVLIPVYAALAVLVGLAVRTGLDYCQKAPVQRKKSLEIFVYTTCLIQLCLLMYNPLKQIPTQKDLDAGRNLVNLLHRLDRDVYIPYHGYLSVMAGKRSYAHLMALCDFLRGGNEQVKAELREEIKRAVRQKRFSAILVDYIWFRKDFNWFIIEVSQHYDRRVLTYEGKKIFIPVTGMRTRPQFIYYPSKGGHLTDKRR